MLVKIFHSPLSTVAEDNLILSLKNRDKSQKHIIVFQKPTYIKY